MENRLTVKRALLSGLPSAMAVLLLGAFAVPREALAQPSLAVLEAAARSRALDNREARALAEQRRLEALRAWHGLLPSFGVRGAYRRNQYPSVAYIPPATEGGQPITATFIAQNQWELALTLRLPLVDAARWGEIHAAEQNARAEAAQRLATGASVSDLVASTYYQLLGAQAVVLAAQRTLRAAEENAAYMAVQRGAGVVSRADVLRSRAEVESGRQDVAQAEYTRATLVRALETLTGLAVPPPYRTLPPDDLHPEAPLEHWLARLPTVPAVIAQRHRVQAAKALALRERAALLPVLEAEASEHFTNSVGFGESPYYSVGLTATWNLDLATHTGARAADAAAEAVTASADRAVAAARDDIHDTWHRVAALIARSRAARAQLDVSKQIVAFAGQELAAGTTLLIDVIQAKRDAFSAEVDSIQADAELAAARASLRISAGAPLPAGAPQ